MDTELTRLGTQWGYFEEAMAVHCTTGTGNLYDDDVQNNYIFTVYIFTAQESTIRTLVVLDTDEGYNYVSRSHFPSTNVHINFIPSLIGSDANGCKFQIVCITFLFSRLSYFFGSSCPFTYMKYDYLPPKTSF